MQKMYCPVHRAMCRSIRNTAESHYLIDLLKMLREKKVNPGSIGVITPYRAQEKHIKRLIKKE